MFEYGAGVGFWRLHRIFTGFGVRVTIFGCARALAANPPAAAAIAASRLGHLQPRLSLDHHHFGLSPRTRSAGKSPPPSR